MAKKKNKKKKNNSHKAGQNQRRQQARHTKRGKNSNQNHNIENNQQKKQVADDKRPKNNQNETPIQDVKDFVRNDEIEKILDGEELSQAENELELYASAKRETETDGKSQGHSKSFAIKVGFILILIVFLVIIYSANNAKNVDLKSVETSLVKEEDLGKEMTKASDRDLMRFIGLDSENYEQVIYYKSTKELAVEELLIVKVASKGQLDGIAEAVESRVDGEIDVYASYGPKQVAQLESAVLREKGNYYFYCTSDKAEDYEEVFMNAVQ